MRVALALSFGWSLGVWWIGEGLGGILTGSASPLTGAPGAALLYLLIGLIIWPAADESGAGAKGGGALGERGTRIAWALLWLGSAALWLLPADRSPQAVSQAIAAAPSGAAWLSRIQAAAAAAAGGRGLEIAIAAAAVSALIGLSVLLDRWSAPLLAVSVVTALSSWLIGQGIGGMLTGTGTDPGTGPLLVLLALSVYRLQPRQRLSTMSLLAAMWDSGVDSANGSRRTASCRPARACGWPSPRARSRRAPARGRTWWRPACTARQ